jgi:peptidase E
VVKGRAEDAAPEDFQQAAEHPEGADTPLGIEYANLDPRLKPIYLLADSQLLFWKNPAGESFVRLLRDRLDTVAPAAAYIGASNGDDPAFYEIFEAAMDEAGIRDRRQIPSELEAEDLAFVDRADWILLAGGDVERGWRTFQENGLSRILQRRYYEGTLLMGISAGAVQLGLGTLQEPLGEKAREVTAGADDDSRPVIETFRLIPHVISAHQEAEGWQELAIAVRRFGGHARGYGIPFGGGLAYHPDHALEPLRRPVTELVLTQGQLVQSVVLPGTVEPEEGGDPEPVN